MPGVEPPAALNASAVANPPSAAHADRTETLFFYGATAEAVRATLKAPAKYGANSYYA